MNSAKRGSAYLFFVSMIAGGGMGGGGWGEDGVVEGMGGMGEGCEGMWREGKGRGGGLGDDVGVAWEGRC